MKHNSTNTDTVLDYINTNVVLHSNIGYTLSQPFNGAAAAFATAFAAAVVSCVTGHEQLLTGMHMPSSWLHLHAVLLKYVIIAAFIDRFISATLLCRSILDKQLTRSLSQLQWL